MVMMTGVCGGVPILRSFRGRSRLFCASTKKEKVIVISGPTGAGKSRLALELAERLNGEIISADSVQVYRGLDVGSAKPSSADRKEVPHHLIDILHPSEDYSVGQFFEDARRATKDILNNGRVPIVTAEAYSELAHLQKDGDWDAAVELVMKAGDPKAQSLAANDWYRLRRSLEIIKSTGLPPSAFRIPYDSFRDQSDSSETNHSHDRNSAAGVSKQDPKDLDYEFICFFLSSYRLDLYRQIDFRYAFRK